MLSGTRRKSARISELEARRAEQAKIKKEKGGTSKLAGAEETGTKKGSKKPGKKRKTRPVHDLVDYKFEFQVMQDGTSSGQDGYTIAALMLPEIPLPAKEKLVLMMEKLKRKDYYGIFAKPVDPNEVDQYYDVIKEPMDFSTIANKIDRGSYKTLNDFEPEIIILIRFILDTQRDIYLVFSNALYFNAPDTIYHKQAIAIRDLAQRLLHILMIDPKNLKLEFGKKKTKKVGKKKDDAECSNSCNKTTGNETASKAYACFIDGHLVLNGCSNEKGSEDFLVWPRCTYTPHTSFGNESFMSQVLKSKKKIELENKLGGSKSLMRFVKDLGPTAQMVAMRKLGGVGINSALSLAFLGNGAGHQRFSGREVDIQNNTSKQQASTVHTTNIYEVNSDHLGGAHPQAMADGLNLSEGSSSTQPFGSLQSLGSHYPGGFHQGNVEQGGQVSNWFMPIGLGVDEADSSQSGNVKPMVLGLEPIPDAADPTRGGCKHGGKMFSWFNPTELGLEPILDAAGTSHSGNVNLGRKISNWFKPSELELEPIPDATSTNHGGIVEHGGQISDWFKPTKMGLELIPDAAGPDYDIQHGGQLSKWFKQTVLGPEPISDDWLQEHCGSLPEMNMSSQAEPLSLQGWTITPYDEKMINTTPYGCYYDRYVTQEQGALKIGTPADDQQKQPLEEDPFLQHGPS
ncbi:hypothetical protein JRO89_XS14G0084400 [Xanthoceras sorbifolium]|uniref:Bromo domain-containing protein n=1 Tax=Xanthoceras sorbifolium TaxID=99658 RepID=A0ABQ8H4M4_9ROSI|nr:hypothetical protein JRO89_XS14G0084400 [Xanthoceras sorbifolium]